jgi:hypothetical protein
LFLSIGQQNRGTLKAFSARGSTFRADKLAKGLPSFGCAGYAGAKQGNFGSTIALRAVEIIRYSSVAQG